MWFYKLKIFLINSTILANTYFGAYYEDKLVCEKAAEKMIAFYVYEGAYSVEGGDFCWQGPIEAWDFDNGWKQ